VFTFAPEALSQTLTSALDRQDDLKAAAAISMIV